jgi:23S rRNA (cytosine1962-C5)-methyltransferase
MRQLVVDGYSEGWLGKGFPWVYPKEVVKGSARPGQVVELRSGAGKVLGTGLADEGFLAARVFRHDGGVLDAAWLASRLDRATALRDLVVPADTDAFRLVNAECDGLPGVRIDWWRAFATIVFDSPSLAPLLPLLLDALRERRQPRGVYLWYRRDPRDRERPSPHPPPGLVDGHAPPGAVRVRELGASYDVWPQEGPDVGLYPDMREVRAWLAPTWGGAEVLNTFGYTGAFSVAAALGGAASVTTVDLSAKYLERAEANFRANELDPSPHEFLEEDTFKALDRFRRTGRTFDRVILDPPSYSHGAGTWSAKTDTPRLVAAAARVTAPDGWIVACNNAGDVPPRTFDGWLQEGLRKAGREAQIVANLSQAADHPASTTFPEGRYLKVRVLRLD